MTSSYPRFLNLMKHHENIITSRTPPNYVGFIDMLPLTM